MRMRTFAPLRIIVAGLAALTLSVAAGELTGAQDEQEPSGDAQIIRDLVHSQRERVLEEIAANMAGERDDAEPRVIEDAEPEDGEAEDGEPEDGEPERDEAAGGEGEACEPAASEPGAEADVAAAEDGEASASEGDGGQPEGAEPEASGETTVCDLPATGIGATHESAGGLPFVAALVALTAAGLGLRRRFCVV
jgi:hypothetical protein